MATTKGVEVTGIYNKMPLFRACPNCGSQIHVRKLACPCGHSVFRGSKLLTTRNASRKSDVGAARALETNEQTAKRRKSDRKRVRETRVLETEEQTAKRRKSDRKRVRETRALETKEQTAKRRKSDRKRVRETRALETEEQTAKCRKSDRKRVRETRALETEEQTAKRRKSDRKRVRETRALETEEQTAKRRKSDRKRVRETRALETEEQTAKRRKSNRKRVRETRVLETEEQTAKRRKSDRKRVVQRRSNVSVEAAIDLFITKTKQGPDYVCTSCHRLMYRANVVSLNKCKYVKASQSLLDKVVGDDQLYASLNGTYWICRTCDSALSRGQMPVQSIANNLELSSIPSSVNCVRVQ